MDSVPSAHKKTSPAKTVSWVPGLQVLTLWTLPESISLNINANLTLRQSSSPPYNMSVFLDVLFYFFLSGMQERWSVVARFSRSWEFTRVRFSFFFFQDEIHGAGCIGLLLKGLSCWKPWIPFWGCHEMSSQVSGPLKHNGMDPWQTLSTNRPINAEHQV